MYIPKAAVINDLSGLGKCSLTVAIPILSAMGVQACPLPTGVLSNQTGFPSYACADLTAQLDNFAAEWRKRHLTFDGIYTGFLCSVRQAQQIAQFLETFRTPETMVLVDPVLGDNGRIYPALPPEMVEAIRSLVCQADVITPNYTEACLLTGRRFQNPGLEQAWGMARQLADSGPGTVIITGVCREGMVCNAVYLAAADETFFVGNRWIGGRSYSGTGDILASVLCGGLLRGMTAQESLSLAARFLEASIAEAVEDETDPNEGVAFENHMELLIRRESFS